MAEHTTALKAISLAEVLSQMWDRIDNATVTRTRVRRLPRFKAERKTFKPTFKAWRKAHREQ